MVNKDTHILIMFSREDLYKVCVAGFMATKIGAERCIGWFQRDRLDMIEGVRYERLA
jgi:hypothetical protein